MDTKNSLDKQYQEVIAESMKNIIGENAKEEVRRLLKEAEDEDSFSEEEVDDDTATTDKEKIVDTDSEVEDGSEDNADDAVDTDTEEVEDMESSEADPMRKKPMMIYGMTLNNVRTLTENTIVEEWTMVNYLKS